MRASACAGTYCKDEGGVCSCDPAAECVLQPALAPTAVLATVVCIGDLASVCVLQPVLAPMAETTAEVCFVVSGGGML